MAKHYSEELVYTESEDGVILAGLAIRPIAQAAKPIAVVWIPGLSINFYHPSIIPVGRELAGHGYTFVIGNHRGHDIGANLWRKQKDADGMSQTFGGALWERFEESPFDVAAWIDFATDQGFKGVALVGHSAGASKVVYYLAHRQDPRVVGLVVASTGISPVRDLDLVAQAEQMVADGRGEELLPWGSFKSFFIGAISAQAYLSRSRVPDLFGVNTPGSEIAQIRCPLFLCYGTNEGYDANERLELIQRNASSARRVETALFEGANHGYDDHEQQVAQALAHWIDTL